ncbi:hypothetical protein OOK41_16020 [Micromonospora sp. NBC_01655]|uniref:hypothetical protein n=1 Tax=Micromonospora sp. NBC_01655 TaxID=2975983 RepID=UPI00224E3F58|nr:hypothetical protein [Micromonospora sp. NBC_01655]MCX4471795.1 hypothetical protein [Micromonospora sp. NBC_01655]
MNNFFGELAKQLAERWVGLLALPGLLFVATAWAGIQLGWSHAVDLPLLASRATGFGAALGRASGPAQALAVIGLLLASSGVGLTVQALAAPVRAGLLGLWPPGLRRARGRLADARGRRWHRLVANRWELQNRFPAASRTPAQQAEVDEAAARVNRLALAAPTRPTWMGDRIAAVEQVALDRYGLDLRFGWSRLWLVLPDPVRADLSTANGQFAATVVTTAWALPYVVLGIVWWPALLIALAVGMTGWLRARAAVADLADLSEAVLDIHGRTLAVALGVAPAESTGPLSLSEGDEITRHVRKGR